MFINFEQDSSINDLNHFSTQIPGFSVPSAAEAKSEAMDTQPSLPSSNSDSGKPPLKKKKKR